LAQILHLNSKIKANKAQKMIFDSVSDIRNRLTLLLKYMIR